MSRGRHTPKRDALLLKLGLKAPATGINQRAEKYAKRAVVLARAKENRVKRSMEVDNLK